MIIAKDYQTVLSFSVYSSLSLAFCGISFLSTTKLSGQEHLFSGSNTLLNSYPSIPSFRVDKGEGWFYDKATKNLWIRKNSSETQNAVKILLR